MSTPPTPAISDQSSGRRRTTKASQSMISNGSASKTSKAEKSRATGSPRNRRNTKNARVDKPKIPRLDAPLSELTKDYEHIPLRNMEEWVNRPAEVRWKEAEKRKGYVTRPMNSFMLYRSAFAERTKIWCLQNNHQVVSSVSGKSWPLEPPQIREQYSEYARVERDNHQKAHPGYKFSPSKAHTTNRKRKGESDEEDEDDEPSSLDDPDVDWRPSHGKASRSRQNRRPGREAGYPSNSSPLHRGALNQEFGLNRSSYQYNNPGKPLPVAMTGQSAYGPYYRTAIHPNRTNQNVEDVRIYKTESPGMHNSAAAQPLIGLPGAHHYELLDHHSQTDSPPQITEQQVDPVLLAYDGDFTHQGPPQPTQDYVLDQQFHDYDQDSLFANDPSTLEYAAAAASYGSGATSSWPVMHNEMDRGDPLDEFDKWMEENNNR